MSLEIWADFATIAGRPARARGHARLALIQRPGQIAQCWQQLVRSAEHLDHDMVGPGPQMLAQRLAVSSGVPQATRASTSLSLPGWVTSASVKPIRFQLLT